MAKNFLNVKETDINIQEVQRASNRPTPTYIIVKMAKSKDKERILQSAREKKKELIIRESTKRLSADFSAETLKARRECQDIFKALKGKNLQPRILYAARISFKIEGEIKDFSNKRKLKHYSNTKPILKEILKELL